MSPFLVLPFEKYRFVALDAGCHRKSDFNCL